MNSILGKLVTLVTTKIKSKNILLTGSTMFKLNDIATLEGVFISEFNVFPIEQ